MPNPLPWPRRIAARRNDFDALDFSLSLFLAHLAAQVSSFARGAVILTRQESLHVDFSFSVIQIRSRIFDLSLSLSLSFSPSSLSVSLSYRRFNAEEATVAAAVVAMAVAEVPLAFTRRVVVRRGCHVVQEPQYPPESRRRYALILYVLIRHRAHLRF